MHEEARPSRRQEPSASSTVGSPSWSIELPHPSQPASEASDEDGMTALERVRWRVRLVVTKLRVGAPPDYRSVCRGHDSTFTVATRRGPWSGATPSCEREENVEPGT